MLIKDLSPDYSFLIEGEIARDVPFTSRENS